METIWLNKKALTVFKDWAEILGLFLLVVGFIIAVMLGSAVMLYLTIFVSGMLFGRFWYKIRNTLKFPWFMVILFFLFGFIMGSLYGSKIVIVMLFLFGMVVSYYLHDRKFIHSEEY